MSFTGALVYVVDDDACARDGVADLIRSAGLMARTFASAEEFLTAARLELPGCVVLDVKLPGVSGLDVQQELAKSSVQVPIIFLTGYGDIPMTVRAVKAGAVNVLTKPFDDEELLNAVRQCITSCGDERLYVESETHLVRGGLQERVARTASADQDRARKDDLGRRARMVSEELGARMHKSIVGASAKWREVLQKATQVAKTDTTVLLTGESGTGKEVVARFIHAASARQTGPFVALNCAALPEQLLESELFGYERGAFTSAQQAKPGQVEQATGGVLFLDEVSEMSLSAQAKFLRVLQEREFQRLGGTRLLKANIRVIAATNRDLRKAVERGDFREDLFYRLGVFDIEMPPLRDRPSDIVPLTDTFLQEIGRSFGRPPAGLTRDARTALLQYEWPGNVRELRNVLERAVILCEGALIDANHLTLQSGARRLRDDTTDLGVVECTTIARVLRDCRGNKTKAARQLGLTRTQLHLRIRKYRLEETVTA
jgi:DNA-binding NtrC family response regulator